MPATILASDIDSVLARLSYQDQQRILRNLLWDVFGDVEEDGTEVLIPGRTPDKVDTLSLLASLEQEFFPDKDLGESRLEAADAAFNEFDFTPLGYTVAEWDSWDRQNDAFDEWTIVMHCEGDILPKFRAGFIVRFSPGTATVVEAYPGDPH